MCIAQAISSLYYSDICNSVSLSRRYKWTFNSVGSTVNLPLLGVGFSKPTLLRNNFTYPRLALRLPAPCSISSSDPSLSFPVRPAPLSLRPASGLLRSPPKVVVLARSLSTGTAARSFNVQRAEAGGGSDCNWAKSSSQYTFDLFYYFFSCWG